MHGHLNESPRPSTHLNEPMRSVGEKRQMETIGDPQTASSVTLTRPHIRSVVSRS